MTAQQGRFVKTLEHATVTRNLQRVISWVKLVNTCILGLVLF